MGAGCDEHYLQSHSVQFFAAKLFIITSYSKRMTNVYLRSMSKSFIPNKVIQEAKNYLSIPAVCRYCCLCLNRQHSEIKIYLVTNSLDCLPVVIPDNIISSALRAVWDFCW